MGKVTHMQPDKSKKVIAKQDEPKRPPTLGEPSEVTNWLMHIEKKHTLKHFVKIVDGEKGQKQAMVHAPDKNQYFIAVKEEFAGGYYYVWILCLTNGSDRINWRINSGDVQFVLWDVPEETKTEEPAVAAAE